MPVDPDLQELVADFKKDSKGKFGHISMGADSAHADIKSWISSGVTPLDTVCWGGIPRGRIIEIFGEFSHGKSTLLESILGNHQQDGGISILILSEGAISKERMRRMGVDVDNLVVWEVESVEAGFRAVFKFLRRIEENEKLRERRVCIGWDSISASPTEAELAMADASNAAEEKEAKYSGGQAAKPRKTREGLRILTDVLARTETTLIFVSQTSATMGRKAVYYKGPDEASGTGKGIKFWASIRIHTAAVGRLQDKNAPWPEGIQIRFTLIKSKICPPGRKVEAPMSFLYGFDDLEAMRGYLASLPDDHPNRVCWVSKGGWHNIRFEDGEQKKARYTNYRPYLQDHRDWLRRNCLESYGPPSDEGAPGEEGEECPDTDES